VAALASLLIVVTLSLLMTRIAAVALVYTGVSVELAEFQARSAFTGVGFTTNESEQIVTHPVRRRIVFLLMLLGNAGIVTAVSSLILTFINAETPQAWGVRLLLLGLGLFLLWVVATSAFAERYLSRLIRWALQRWTQLDARDYVNLLHLSGDYSVTELKIEPGDWVSDRKLAELHLRQEGVLVLGIQRSDGGYVGAPKGETMVYPGDTMLIYGRGGLLEELSERKAGILGERAHQKAVANQQAVLRGQDEEERQRERESQH
jgi:hypothetical protein